MGRTTLSPSRISPAVSFRPSPCCAGSRGHPSGPWAQIVINEIDPDPAGSDDPLERVEICHAGTTRIDEKPDSA